MLCIIIIFRFERIYETNFICRYIKILSNLLLPILGHIGFMPIFSMLMNIFLCYNAIGNNLTDSYLDQDCTTFCYTSKHKLYAVLSGICIGLYVPAAIYCRPI